MKRISLSLLLLALVACSKGTGVSEIPFADRVSVSDVQPSNGNAGDEVTIRGAGFGDGELKVFFGNFEAQVEASSDSEILLIVPASPIAGKVDVKIVEVVSGEYLLLTAAFSYREATNCGPSGPQILSINDPVATGGDIVYLTGKNFIASLMEGSSVSVGGKIALRTQNQSETRLTFQVPNLDNACPSSECPLDIVVANPDGCTGVFSGFSYQVSNVDSDGDGLSDHDEIFRYGTNKDLEDSDLDKVSDGVEVSYFSGPTDPNDPDTDCDQVRDNVDTIYQGRNPSVAEPYTLPLTPNDPTYRGYYRLVEGSYLPILIDARDRCKLKQIQIVAFARGAQSALSPVEIDTVNNTTGLLWPSCVEVNASSTTPETYVFPNPNADLRLGAGMNYLYIYPKRCGLTNGGDNTDIGSINLIYERIPPYVLP